MSRSSLLLASASLATVGTLLASAPTAQAASAPRLAAAGQAACHAAYAVETVGDLGGTASWPTALANNGFVGGTARTGTSARPQVPHTEFRGQVRELERPAGSTFGRVLGVTENRRAAGEVFTAGPERSQPAFWDARGRLTVLADSGVAEDLNNRGEVVGSSPDAHGVATATVWHHGRTTHLPGLADPDHAPDEHGHATPLVSRALDIDDSGVVVGSATVLSEDAEHPHPHTHAVLWDRRRQPHDLGALHEHGTTRALAVSGRSVVGEASRADGTWSAVTFTTAGPVELAGTPWRFEKASDVNRHGEVVGEGTTFYGNAGFGGAAYVWCEGRAVDLATVAELPEGVTLQSARAVNDRGQIAAIAKDATGATRSVLLTPAAEPSRGRPRAAGSGATAAARAASGAGAHRTPLAAGAQSSVVKVPDARVSPPLITR